jgi:hypothetical protein
MKCGSITNHREMTKEVDIFGKNRKQFCPQETSWRHWFSGITMSSQEIRPSPENVKQIFWISLTEKFSKKDRNGQEKHFAASPSHICPHDCSFCAKKKTKIGAYFYQMKKLLQLLRNNLSD